MISTCWHHQQPLLAKLSNSRHPVSLVRIFFLSPSGRLLGARKSLLELVRALPNAIEPLVACPGATDLAQELEKAGVPHVAVPHFAWRKFPHRLGGYLREIPQLRAAAKRFRPNVIHANEYHSCPYASRVVSTEVAAKWPLVTHVRLTMPRPHIRKHEVDRSTRIVAVSEAVRRDFDGTGLEDRVRVVYNGVDLAGWERGKSVETVPLPETAGWPEGALVCGLFGLVSERKNQLVAADAVARAAAMGADVRLLLAGDAFKGSIAYGDRLKERLAQEDLAGRSVWLPFQQDVKRVYTACHVNLLISKEEGFGRTIIEAGALGLPSVGTPIGGIPELIADGETGWIVPEGDAGALAEVLVAAWRDRQEVRRRGLAARARVAENFTLAATIRKLTAVWEEAIAHPLRR